MAEIRNLTRNGETFYPLTHEKAVIGMEEFKETITEQIDNYRPIEITGDVTNAPDEEDITADSNNLLKFKNRNNLYGLGKVILRRGSSFASQVTQANTIYVIQYNFDLDSGRINMPNGSILLFEGGALSNGTLVCADLYDVRLVYYQDVDEILSSVTLEGNFIHKACDKDTVREILVDNSSITKDVNDVLSVKANGIQNSHLNSNVVDASSITLDSNNKISIKDGGVTGAKLNSSVVNTDDLSIVNNKVQLSNRTYNQVNPEGMGMIILRKDQSFASQLTQTNTIYVIRYDFTLTNDVTIPANCVLEFDGGSISGAYTLTGQNTTIKTNSIGFLYENVTLSGSFSNDELYVSWYKKEHDYNDSVRINKLTNNSVSKNKTVVLDSDVFYITNSIQLRSNVSLKGLAGCTYLLALADNNIINLVKSDTNACCIKDLHFDFATGNKNGHGLYCNFMMNHLTIYRTRSSGVKVGYSSLYFDTYVPEGTDNGVNAVNIYNCIFAGNGSGIVMLQGGDNCNIRDNNFLTNGGYCIYWDGIVGTASVNIENNSIVGGGKDCLFSISNVGTATIRNNQCEASHPMVAGNGEDTTTALLKIGYAALRQPCANIDISHNNLNLNTSGTSTVSSQNTILLKYVYGGIISNNLVSNSVNYVTLSTSCYGIIIVKNLINADPEHFPANIIDPALRAIVIDEESKTINYAGYCPIYNITTTQPRKIAGSIVPNVGGRVGEFASYNAAIGANVGLDGFPTIRSGSTDIRIGSSLPAYLRYGANMVGFCYFDTTLGKPLWNKGWDGTKIVWVDATGNPV